MFASSRYGYTISYPTGWTTREVPGEGGLHPGEDDEAGMDVFENPDYEVAEGSGIRLFQPVVGVSQYELPAATVIDKWISPTEQHIDQDHGIKPESIDQITIGGAHARLETFHVVDAGIVYTAYVAEVIQDGAGYTIECLYAQPTAATEVSAFDRRQRAVFEQMLASVKFS